MLLCQGGRCRQPQHAGHHRCDHQTNAKRSSLLWLSNHFKNGFILWSSNAKYYKHKIGASSSGRANLCNHERHLGIVYMFQSKHISSSGKRGEKTWSNRSCFSQVWLGWWRVPQVKTISMKPYLWKPYLWEKNESCSTNFVNSIFDWSQTFSFLALILTKYETFLCLILLLIENRCLKFILHIAMQLGRVSADWAWGRVS